MKTFTLFIISLFVIACNSLFAQNWSVLSSTEDTLHFTGKSGNVLSFTYDSISTSPANKIIYPSREFELVTTATSTPYQPEKALIFGESWLGDHIIETSAQAYFIYHGDSLTLPVHTGIAQSTINSLTLTISIVSSMVDSLPTGITDSIKVFQVSVSDNLDSLGKCLDGTQIVLSKNHGLISYPACFKLYVSGDFPTHNSTIRYLTRETVKQTNFSLPSINQFFDYSPGDELHYYFASVVGYRILKERRVYTILSKNTDANNITSYEVALNMVQIPYTGSWTYQKDTLTWHLSNDPMEEDEPLFVVEPMLTGKSKVCQPQNQNSSPYVVTGYWKNNISTQFTPDPTSLYVRQKQWDFNGNDSCSFVGYNPFPVSNTAYIPKIGMTYSEIPVYHGPDQSLELKYYKIKGESWGTPYTIGIEEKALTQFKVYPNPAKQHLYIEGLDKDHISIEWSISDMIGRELLSGVIAEKGVLNIESLNPGSYLLKLGNTKCIKFIKE